MKFLIISHTIHKQQAESLIAYAPYVREMDLWLKHVEEVEVVAPMTNKPRTNLDIPYEREDIIFNTVPSISFTSIKNSIISITQIPSILISIFNACKRADHIHLRCPGNIGLLGCVVQMFFPKKIKTAKYAGNWDPKSKQPLSYRIQKAILRHLILSRNMQVLVYGLWENQSKNIKSFFTATYNSSDAIKPIERDYNGVIHFVFVGSLVKGKHPLFVVKIVEALYNHGYKVELELYGEGLLKKELKKYIFDNKLEIIVHLKGAQNSETIKKVLKKTHFLVLPSKSEGWPKAITEAMFFGTIPIATKVSCIPYILDYGKRGILIDTDINDVIEIIKEALKHKDRLKAISKLASNWSQNYTLDVFEKEIVKLLNH